MKKIDNFTNLYPVTKTLRFKLIPVGKTKENFDKNNLLKVDKERAVNYDKAKQIIDKFYNKYINSCLNNFKFNDKPNNLKEYYSIINGDMAKDEKNKRIKEIQKSLRTEVVLSFSDTARKKEIYDKLFNSKLFDEILDDNNITDEEKEVINKFYRFNTYFVGFFNNRKNIFSDKDKVGSISYRLVNENLKTFVNNIRVYLKVNEALKDDIITLENEYKDILKDFRVEDIFNIDYYRFCLTGEDINKYNLVIGGYSKEEKVKIKGLNEYINLYNQKNKENSKLPKFKPLYKQILSENETKSFRFDAIEDDNRAYNLIDNILESIVNGEKEDALDIVKKTFIGIISNKYESDKIYLSSSKFKDLSVKCFGDYNAINFSIGIDYDKNHKMGKSKEKYENDKEKYIKNIKYLSIDDIENYVELAGYDKERINNVLNDEVNLIIDYIKESIENYNNIDKSANIKANERNISAIKDLLDSLLQLYRFKELFCKYDELELIDLNFYGELSEIDFLNDIVSIYNKIRNYIIKKPYKSDKIKLNFDCPNLLSGWDTSFEKNSTIIIKSNNKYYLAICNEKLNSDDIDNLFEICENDTSLYYEYNFQKQDNKNFPRLFIRSKRDRFAPAVEKYNLPINDIIDIYDRKLFTTENRKKNEKEYKESLTKIIDYFKLGIESHEIFKVFDFKWKRSEDYISIDKFYNDAITMCYMLKPKRINFKNIVNLCDSGKIYMFEIYNKDFSMYSKGIKNLHTMYFEELFDNKNLNDVIYKLNGKAELFYREKSLEYNATHPKNNAIINKNKNNDKRESIFSYDLVKDKRFTQDQFEFHVPITINFKADEGLYNDKVNMAIANCKDNYVIGIDRGERNLIYINVVSEQKGLIEQLSLNDIVNEYNGNTYRTDYHGLLDKREKERDEAKKSWNTIANIKELKEGYVSQVVHKICELVEKYDAIIVMEDLNTGFKNNRIKVEKQVYQKFEKMLIDKLNLYINKKQNDDNNGGLLKGYQLTRPYESNNKMAFQNGFIFYIAPWNTSKIDPTTGFVNLFRLSNYKTMQSKKEFISKFDSIVYNGKEDIFEFAFDYRNFDYGAIDYIGNWMITSFGKRILTFRNKEKNSSWDYHEKYPTEELKELFASSGINYESVNIKDEIAKINNKEFFDRLFNILRLILQMRNSKPKCNENDCAVDYISSPVKNKNGKYYNSNEVKECEKLPIDADANGAYNIARKGLMIIDRIKKCQNDKLTVITNKEWLEYAQTHLSI